MHVDELPYHSSFSIILILFQEGSFFINIGKCPKTMQKVRNDPLLDNKIFKRRALLPYKDDLYYDKYMHKFLGSSCTKSQFYPTSETPMGQIQCHV